MNNENQNQSKLSAFGRFMAGKGLYIALSLCLVAIGVFGYLISEGMTPEYETAPAVAVTEAQSMTETVEETDKSPTVEVMAPQVETEIEAPDEDPEALAREAAHEAAMTIKIWPMAGGISREYSLEQLCYNVTTGDWRTHDGVDMYAVLGEPVMAVTSGTVTAIYQDELEGTVVEISHEDDYSTRYCNLAEVPTVAVGQAVAPGDVIGAVGDTSLLECGQEPHLHLEVYHQGFSIDPREYIDQ